MIEERNRMLSGYKLYINSKELNVVTEIKKVKEGITLVIHSLEYEKKFKGFIKNKTEITRLIIETDNHNKINILKELNDWKSLNVKQLCIKHDSEVHVLLVKSDFRAHENFGSK